MTIHYRKEQQVTLRTCLGLVPLNDRTRTGILNRVVGSQRRSRAIPNQSSRPQSRLEDRAVPEPFLDLVRRKHLKGPRGHEPFPVWAGLSDLEVERRGFDLCVIVVERGGCADSDDGSGYWFPGPSEHRSSAVVASEVEREEGGAGGEAWWVKGHDERVCGLDPRDGRTCRMPTELSITDFQASPPPTLSILHPGAGCS